MSLKKALENLKFDKRLIELNIKLGRINPSDLSQAIQSLPDLQADCEKLDIEKEEKESN